MAKILSNIVKGRKITTVQIERSNQPVKRVKPSTPSRSKLQSLGYTDSQINSILRQWC